MQLQKILRQVPDRRGKQGQDDRLWSILGLIVGSLLSGISTAGKAARQPFGDAETSFGHRQQHYAAI